MVRRRVCRAWNCKLGNKRIPGRYQATLKSVKEVPACFNALRIVCTEIILEQYSGSKCERQVVW
jgi:hypothetical protein